MKLQFYMGAMHFTSIVCVCVRACAHTLPGCPSWWEDLSGLQRSEATWRTTTETTLLHEISIRKRHTILKINNFLTACLVNIGSSIKHRAETNAKAWSISVENQRSQMTAESINREKERKRARECYLTVRSHHTVRGRRLRVRRALGTRWTLWHCTK